MSGTLRASRNSGICLGSSGFRGTPPCPGSKRRPDASRRSHLASPLWFNDVAGTICSAGSDSLPIRHAPHRYFEFRRKNVTGTTDHIGGGGLAVALPRHAIVAGQSARWRPDESERSCPLECGGTAVHVERTQDCLGVVADG
jgi:hypothetical protein